MQLTSPRHDLVLCVIFLLTDEAKGMFGETFIIKTVVRTGEAEICTGEVRMEKEDDRNIAIFFANMLKFMNDVNLLSLANCENCSKSAFC